MSQLSLSASSAASSTVKRCLHRVKVLMLTLLLYAFPVAPRRLDDNLWFRRVNGAKREKGGFQVGNPADARVCVTVTSPLGCAEHRAIAVARCGIAKL